MSLQNNEIDLNDITIEVSDNSVGLTKENFIKLVTKIEQMNLEIYENQEQINNLLANNANINLSKHEEKVINLSFSTKIKLLAKVLYNQRHIQVELNPDNFCLMIENYEPELKGFFDEMVDAIIPISRLEKNKQAAKKSVVGFCYLLAGLRNKFINSFKLDLGLYLVSSGTSVQGIDTIANLGISVCYKTIANYKKAIAQNYPKELEEYFKEHMDFLHIFNIDDYHSIHGWRRPETTSLSSVIYLATCVTQLVNLFQQFLII